ncbi:MAG: hypothetical protein AABX39_03140 [Nanoarchaeota archaeon]
MKRLNKKGGAAPPNADPAALLILIITLALVGYVLFIPSDARRELLGEENTTLNKSLPIGFIEENVLLKERIGRLDVVKSNEKTLLIPNFKLVETKQDQILGSTGSFTVRKTLLNEESKIVALSIPEGSVENAYLSFQAPTKKGILSIKLNDKLVYEGRLSDSIATIPLPSEALAKTNTLTFSVDGGFLEDKNYQINDLKILGSVKEASTLTVTNPFRMSPEELSNFESGSLTYHLSCDAKNSGVLNTMLNENNLFSSVPSCDDVNRIELFKEYFKEGKNSLIFRASKGVHDFDNVKLNLKLSKTKSFTQYFEVNDNLYSDVVLDRFKKIIFEVRFVDDRETKEAEVNVNGRFKTIDQKTNKFAWELSKEADVLQAGRNYLEITPKSPLNIVEVRIFVEDAK